jgi:SulP family sulfate permease
LTLPPAISFASHRELWAPAFVLAIISFTEAMSSCRILARRTNMSWDENQELVGQGLAKIASGFSGAFPVSGSLSRSALNFYAGAVSAWSSLFATLCVVFSLLFLTDLVAYLPYSVLAAVIIVPVTTLIDFGAFRRLFRISRDDGMAAAVTFIVTLLLSPNLHYGVFAGIGLTMASYLYRRIHPRIIEVGEHADGTLRDRSRFDLPPLAPDLLAVRIDSALNFLTAASLERFIAEKRSANPAIRRILVCASSINDIDASEVEVLQALNNHLNGAGLELYFAAVKHQVARILDKAGMLNELGRERMFSTDREAIEQLRS